MTYVFSFSHHACGRLMSVRERVLLERRGNICLNIRNRTSDRVNRKLKKIYGRVMTVRHIVCSPRSLGIQNRSKNRRQRRWNSEVSVWNLYEVHVVVMCWTYMNSTHTANTACSVQQVHQPDWVHHNAIINKKLWNARIPLDEKIRKWRTSTSFCAWPMV